MRILPTFKQPLPTFENFQFLYKKINIKIFINWKVGKPIRSNPCKSHKYYILAKSLQSRRECKRSLPHYFEIINPTCGVRTQFVGVFTMWYVSAKYSCGFFEPQISLIIVNERYLDYF